MTQELKMANTANDQQDRTLEITCAPVLDWSQYASTGNIYATMQYTQGASNPNMPGVVNPGKGDINLRSMPNNANFSENVDIKFILSAANLKDQNGNPITGDNVIRWAHSDEGSWNDNGVNKPLGYGWFCTYNTQTQTYEPTPPIYPDNMSFVREHDLKLHLDDNQDDGGANYGFCIAFVLPTYSNYYISIDPVVTSKGRGTEAPMMLRD